MSSIKKFYKSVEDLINNLKELESWLSNLADEEIEIDNGDNGIRFVPDEVKIEKI